MVFIYDWDEKEFVSLPLNVKLAKLVRISGAPVQFTPGDEHSFCDTGVSRFDK